MRIRKCDKCDLEIEYGPHPNDYSGAGSYPMAGDPACTVQAAMSVVEVDGEYMDLCVENGCLDDFNTVDASATEDKKDKLKDWVKKK